MIEALKPWKCHLLKGPLKQVTFAFGHDFREIKIVIIERYTGKMIAEINPALDGKQILFYAALVRQAPIFAKTMREAVNRLYQAKHPNAIKLRVLLEDALRGLELPIDSAEDS